MKILHILRAPLGGAFRHVKDLARWQREQGHHVFIATAATDGGLGFDGPVVQIPKTCGPRDGYNLAKLLWFIRSQGMDVLHGHGAKGGLYARILGMASGRGAFYTPHGGVLHYEKESWCGRAFFGVERRLQPHTRHLFFESEFARSQYLDKVGALDLEHSVVHNGLKASDFQLPGSDERYSLGFIGELRHIKGVDRLIRALDVWPDPGRRPRCLIAGIGPQEEELKTMARERGLEDHFHFAGFMDKAAFYSAVDLVVAPSRKDSLPYVVMEALAARVPVLAADVGGIKEIFQPRPDLLMETPSPEVIAHRAHGVLQAPDRYRELLAPVFEHVIEAFDIDRASARVTAAYGETA